MTTPHEQRYHLEAVQPLAEGGTRAHYGGPAGELLVNLPAGTRPAQWLTIPTSQVLVRGRGFGKQFRPVRPSDLEDDSPVSVPAEDGNASERPNAGQHGDLYAESTDSIYVRDPADGLWIPWERSDGEAILDEELPDDAVPLHGEQHNVNDLREIDRQKSRADAAEAKLAEAEAVAAKTKAHYIRRCENLANVRDRIRGERDEARAKLAEVSAVLEETRVMGVTAHAEVEKLRDKLARISAIVAPEHETDEHADDCDGYCDYRTGTVPCAADEVRGDVAYRNGKPIKNLVNPEAGQ